MVIKKRAKIFSGFLRSWIFAAPFLPLIVLLLIFGGLTGFVVSEYNADFSRVGGIENVGGVNVEVSGVYESVFPGDISTEKIGFKNLFDDRNVVVLVDVSGDIKPFVFFDSSFIELNPNEDGNIVMTIVVPKLIEAGTYTGDLIIETEEETQTIPISVDVLSREGKLLDVKVYSSDSIVSPGEVLTLQTDLVNLGKTSEIDVEFGLQLINLQSGEIIMRSERSLVVEDSESVVEDFSIPSEVISGKYMVKAAAYYLNAELETKMQAVSIIYVEVKSGFFDKKFRGFYLWFILMLLMLTAVAIGIYSYVLWNQRRWRGKVENYDNFYNN